MTPIILAILVGCAAVVAAPFVRDRLLPLPKPADAKGRFADLSQGRTHYRWFGEGDGPLFVGVHGLSTPCDAYQAIGERIATAGGRLLTYDLYGRGFSGRPKGLQDRAFHQRQLLDLLADQGVTEPFVIMGYSMGGIIATQFAADHPTRVRGLVLLTAAGTRTIEGRSLGVIKANRFLGAWLYMVTGMGGLAKGIAAARGEHVDVPDIHDIQAAQLGYRGFAPALASSVQGMIGKALETEHHALADAEVPVLALWGAIDDVIPLDAKDTLSRLNPSAENAVFEDAGHGLPYTHADYATAVILRRWPI